MFILKEAIREQLCVNSIGLCQLCDECSLFNLKFDYFYLKYYIEKNNWRYKRGKV